MKFIFSSRRCNVGDGTKAYAEKKLKKLDKFFAGDCVVYVVFTLEKENKNRVEVTADYKGLIFRAQETTGDFKESIDRIIDILIRQIRKHKTKLEKRLRDSDFTFDLPIEENTEPENKIEVIRTKSIVVKPMSVEEAILQMDMLGHDFFVFRTDTTNEINVVYKRKDGNYGLIEPTL